MRKSFLCFVLFGVLSANPNWLPYLQLSGRTNNYRHGGGGLVLAPLRQNERTIFFTQGAIGHWWKNTTGTLGFGLRSLRHHGWAWGVNAFVDVAYSDHRNVYVQGSAGGELFWRGWDLRFNGYLPTSEKRILRTLTTQEVFAIGNNVFYRRDGCVAAEAIYRGFDVDLGYCYPIFTGAVQARVGYFHYESAHVPDVNGPRVQLGYRQDWLFGQCGWEAYVGGEYEYSKHRGNIASGFLSIRLPLGCSYTAQNRSLCDTLRRLGDPVRRAESLYIRAWSICGGKAIAPCINPLGNQMQLFYASGAAPLLGAQVNPPQGTYNDPMSLTQAMAAAGPFDAIVCLDSGGPLESDQPCQLQMGQMLIGTNGGAPIMTPDGELNVPLAQSCPVIQWSGGQNSGAVLVPDVGNQVIGLCVDGATRVECGMGRPRLENLTVRGVEIQNVTVGVLAQWYHNVSVKNTYIHDVERAGIDIRDTSGAIEICNNRVERFGFASSQGRGIMVMGDHENTDLTIQNNRITGNASSVDAGIYVSQSGSGTWNCSLLGNYIRNLDGPAIEVRKSGNDGSLAVDARWNTADNCQQQAFVGLTEGTGELLITASNNFEVGTSAFPSIDIRSTASGPCRLTLENNRVRSIDLTQTSGPLSVYERDRLSEINYRATVKFSGQIDNQSEPDPAIP